MSAIEISTSIGNRALGCSTTQADLTWALAHNPLPSGALPNAVRIDNTSNSVGVYVSITPETETITVPGSSTDGNCFFVAPFGSVTVQIIPTGGSVATSAFNDGSGNCVISGITTDGSAIIIVTPVGA